MQRCVVLLRVRKFSCIPLTCINLADSKHCRPQSVKLKLLKICARPPPPIALARSSFCHATPPRTLICIWAAKFLPLKSLFLSAWGFSLCGRKAPFTIYDDVFPVNWVKCVDVGGFSLDKVDNVAKFTKAMNSVGVFFPGVLCYTFGCGVCDCFSECC